MDRRDVIVIGASAGGVEALTRLVAELPAALPAFICVVLHVPSTGRSALPRILARAGKLPAVHASDNQALVYGQILVAPPDRHLILERGRVRVTRGPREHRHRPSVDALFRSAALAFGPRVMGVVLSGTLEDGTVGLQAIQRHGGVTIVQRPDDALYPSMPTSAINGLEVDHCASASEIGALLATLVQEPAPLLADSDPEVLDIMDSHLERGNSDIELTDGRPSAQVCPDCQGTLYEIPDGAVTRYRCRVGHAFTEDSLLTFKSEDLERALWTALRTLDEKADLIRRLSARARSRGDVRTADQFDKQAVSTAQQADLVRGLILQPDLVESPDSAH